MKYYEYAELEDIKDKFGAEKLVWIIGTIQNEIAEIEQENKKIISDLQDKLHRRNMQIKELKKKISAVKGTAETYLNQHYPAAPDPDDFMEQIVKILNNR